MNTQSIVRSYEGKDDHQDTAKSKDVVPPLNPKSKTKVQRLEDGSFQVLFENQMNQNGTTPQKTKTASSPEVDRQSKNGPSSTPTPIRRRRSVNWTPRKAQNTQNWLSILPSVLNPLTTSSSPMASGSPTIESPSDRTSSSSNASALSQILTPLYTRSEPITLPSTISTDLAPKTGQLAAFVVNHLQSQQNALVDLSNEMATMKGVLFRGGLVLGKQQKELHQVKHQLQEHGNELLALKQLLYEQECQLQTDILASRTTHQVTTSQIKFDQFIDIGLITVILLLTGSSPVRYINDTLSSISISFLHMIIRLVGYHPYSLQPLSEHLPNTMTPFNSAEEMATIKNRELYQETSNGGGIQAPVWSRWRDENFTHVNYFYSQNYRIRKWRMFIIYVLLRTAQTWYMYYMARTWLKNVGVLHSSISDHFSWLGSSPFKKPLTREQIYEQVKAKLYHKHFNDDGSPIDIAPGSLQSGSYADYQQDILQQIEQLQSQNRGLKQKDNSIIAFLSRTGATSYLPSWCVTAVDRITQPFLGVTKSDNGAADSDEALLNHSDDDDHHHPRVPQDLVFDEQIASQVHPSAPPYTAIMSSIHTQSSNDPDPSQLNEPYTRQKSKKSSLHPQQLTPSMSDHNPGRQSSGRPYGSSGGGYTPQKPQRSAGQFAHSSSTDDLRQYSDVLEVHSIDSHTPTPHKMAGRPSKKRTSRRSDRVIPLDFNENDHPVDVESMAIEQTQTTPAPRAKKSSPKDDGWFASFKETIVDMFTDDE